MIDVTAKNAKQLILKADEARKLKQELENIFILSNGTVSCSYYSLSEIENKFPVTAELFKTLST